MRENPFRSDRGVALSVPTKAKFHGKLQAESARSASSRASMSARTSTGVVSGREVEVSRGTTATAMSSDVTISKGRYSSLGCVRDWVVTLSSAETEAKAASMK